MKLSPTRSRPSLVSKHAVSSPGNCSGDWAVKGLLADDSQVRNQERSRETLKGRGGADSGVWPTVRWPCDMWLRGRGFGFCAFAQVSPAFSEWSVCVLSLSCTHLVCDTVNRKLLPDHTQKSQGCCGSGVDFLTKLLSCVRQKPVATSSDVFWSHTSPSY